MPAPANPRVALLGFSIECNKFAPPATKAHFLARTYLEGEAIVTEARGATPTMLPETPGFVAAPGSGPAARRRLFLRPRSGADHARGRPRRSHVRAGARDRRAGRAGGR